MNPIIRRSIFTYIYLIGWSVLCYGHPVFRFCQTLIGYVCKNVVIFDLVHDIGTFPRQRTVLANYTGTPAKHLNANSVPLRVDLIHCIPFQNWDFS